MSSMSVSVTGLDAALARFSNAKPAVLRAEVRAINKVAAKLRTQASKDIRQRYALPAAYLNKHLTLKQAKNGSDAVIKAEKRPTLLSRYAAKQLTTVAKAAKGDARRGIPAGRKQAGVSFKILRAGGRKRENKFFLLPLRAGISGGGNGWGVAIRQGAGRNNYKILHTISVDQAFKALRPGYVQRLPADLAEAFRKQLQHELGVS